MTAEKIKEIADQDRGSYELVLAEFQAIQEAANGSSFEMICCAYAFGFLRGAQAAREDKA